MPAERFGRARVARAQVHGEQERPVRIREKGRPADVWPSERALGLGDAGRDGVRGAEEIGEKQRDEVEVAGRRHQIQKRPGRGRGATEEGGVRLELEVSPTQHLGGKSEPLLLRAVAQRLQKTIKVLARAPGTVAE